MNADRKKLLEAYILAVGNTETHWHFMSEIVKDIHELSEAYLCKPQACNNYESLLSLNKELVEALEALIPLAAHTSPQDISLSQARAILSRAKSNH